MHSLERAYLAECGSAGGFERLFPAEVEVVRVEDAARQTHALAHAVVLVQPENAQKERLEEKKRL